MAADEIERLSAIVAAVDALHRYFWSADGMSKPICGHCGLNWPCWTHLAIHPEDNR